MITLTISLGIIGFIFFIASFALKSHTKQQVKANLLPEREILLHTTFTKYFLVSGIVLLAVTGILYAFFLA